MSLPDVAHREPPTASEGPPGTLGLVSPSRGQHQPGLRIESGITYLHLHVTFSPLLKEWWFKISRRYDLTVPWSAVRHMVPLGYDGGVGRAGSFLSLSGRSMSSPLPASLSFPHSSSHGPVFDIQSQ